MTIKEKYQNVKTNIQDTKVRIKHARNIRSMDRHIKSELALIHYNKNWFAKLLICKQVMSTMPNNVVVRACIYNTKSADALVDGIIIHACQSTVLYRNASGYIAKITDRNRRKYFFKGHRAQKIFEHLVQNSTQRQQ